MKKYSSLLVLDLLSIFHKGTKTVELITNNQPKTVCILSQILLMSRLDKPAHSLYFRFSTLHDVGHN